MRIIGIDPGLVNTGWGLIDVAGNSAKFVACGVIRPKTTLSLAERLASLYEELTAIIRQYQPHEASIEETFVTANGASTLKLGQARGALLLTLSLARLPVAEYAARLVKKSIVGSGAADKSQMQMMVRTLLPGSDTKNADAADALAIALTHMHHRGMQHYKVGA